jgi:hypothetical protein
VLGEAEVLQEGHGDHHHERVVVQAVPAAPVEVVEAEVQGSALNPSSAGAPARTPSAP